MNQITLSKKGLGFIFATFSAVLWGTNGTFCSLLSQFGLSSVNVAVLAPLANFLFFFVILVLFNRSGFRLRGKFLALLAADGLLSALVNVSYVKSVSYFPVGIVSTLVFCNVFTVMILSRLVFKTKITMRKVFAALAALAGVGLVLNVFNQGVKLNGYGLLWILFAILVWSSMVTIEKYLIEQGVDTNVILMYMGLFAVLFLSLISPPWSLAGNIAEVMGKNGTQVLLTILGYGLIPQIACYVLYMQALKYIDPSQVQVAFSLDPVTASVLGYVIFQQTMNLSQIIGIIIILLVVGYVEITENRAGLAEIGS